MRWQDLVGAQERYFSSTFSDSTFGPTWDGVVIAEPPMNGEHVSAYRGKPESRERSVTWANDRQL
jgi:hypothetical protein